MTDLDRLLRELERQGFRVVMNRRCHYRVLAPGGDTVSLPSTPGEYRGLRNAIAHLRRLGFIWKGR